MDALHVVALREPLRRPPSSCTPPGCAWSTWQRNSSRCAHSVSAGTPSRYSARGTLRRLGRGSRTRAGPTCRPARGRAGSRRCGGRRRSCVRYFTQAALEVPGPVVERALELREALARAFAQQVAAVPAHVLERGSARRRRRARSAPTRGPARCSNQSPADANVIDAARDLPHTWPHACALAAPWIPRRRVACLGNERRSRRPEPGHADLYELASREQERWPSGRAHQAARARAGIGASMRASPHRRRWWVR